jgi:ribosomal protein S4
MQVLQKRVQDAVFLAGFANSVKVTKSAVHGRDGGIVYVRVKALAA